MLYALIPYCCPRGIGKQPEMAKPIKHNFTEGDMGERCRRVEEIRREFLSICWHVQY
jgi:hypothetical protein